MTTPRNVEKYTNSPNKKRLLATAQTNGGGTEHTKVESTIFQPEQTTSKSSYQSIEISTGTTIEKTTENTTDGKKYMVNKKGWDKKTEDSSNEVAFSKNPKPKDDRKESEEKTKSNKNLKVSASESTHTTKSLDSEKLEKATPKNIIDYKDITREESNEKNNSKVFTIYFKVKDGGKTLL